MAKTTIGIDIGSCTVKFAICQSDQVRRIITEPVPDQLVRQGRIVSPEAMSGFLKEMARKHRLSGRCAIVLPSALAFSRRISMPAMSAEHLALNLPYEFRDFITEEKEKYYYDYAVLELEYGAEGTPDRMDLMAAATLRSTIREYRDMLRRAGFRLAIAAPEEFAYYNLIRRYEAARPDAAGQEHCFIDLGHTATRIYIFTGRRFEVSRVIEYGGATLEAVISDAFHVDEHLARSYLHSNYEHVLATDACLGVYRAVGMEIMRAINFYRYNNPHSELSAAWLCGGGALISPLTEQLAESVSLSLRPIEQMLPPAAARDGLALSPAAIGMTQQ